jgi:ribose-phosphate pyrophosphokinase
VLEKIVVTNTLPLPPDCDLDRIEVVSIAPIVASTMKAIFEDESVSELFDDDNQR